MSDISEFSTLGSCSSRNIFNSVINKPYKKFFKINYSIEAVSLISLMSKPIDFDVKEINSKREYDNFCVKEDLSKNFLDFIKKDSVDYIILDTYFDVYYNIIEYDKDQYISLSERLVNTDFYKSLDQKREINIFNNFDEYYPLWVKSCDNLFKLFKKCKRSKIILNCSRMVYKYLDSHRRVIENEDFKKLSYKCNPYRNLLDKYILKNFDVDVLPFDFKTLADENHVFGLHPSHFESQFYSQKNKQLLDIISRNKSNKFYQPKNKEIRISQKENVLQSFKYFPSNTRLSDNDKKLLIKDKVFQNLNKYNTARIDIINRNNRSNVNKVKINQSSDENLDYEYPIWFRTSEGEGLVVESNNNFLNLDIECIGDGELNISLKGIDFRVMGKRLPIYVNFTNFLINNKKILYHDEIVTHDHFFNYKVKVGDGQKLSLYFEWLPL